VAEVTSPRRGVPGAGALAPPSIKEPFGPEAALELLEAQGQHAIPGGLHGLDDELVVAPGFIERLAPAPAPACHPGDGTAPGGCCP
jgi:hypothetical protein